MGQYEYFVTRIDSFSNTETTQILDKFSVEGWELIAVTPINANGSTIYINYDDLNAANGTLAANLGNRMNEYFGQVEPVQLPTGSQRGGAKVDDYYLMTMVSFNFMFTDWKGKRVLGKSNKVTCPTFH